MKTLDAKTHTIRIRACLAVISHEKILLVPHYNTDARPVQWNPPGGGVNFGESVQDACLRELSDETGLEAKIGDLLDVAEVILPERQYHSITITYSGRVVGGEMKPEKSDAYGEKCPHWFALDNLENNQYHPREVIEKVLK